VTISGAPPVGSDFVMLLVSVARPNCALGKRSTVRDLTVGYARGGVQFAFENEEPRGVVDGVSEEDAGSAAELPIVAVTERAGRCSMGGIRVRIGVARIARIVALGLIVASTGVGAIGCGSASRDTAGAPSSSGAHGSGHPQKARWTGIVVGGGARGDIARLACPRADDCWAAANMDAGGGKLFHFDGHSWKSAVSPRAAVLYGIDCVDASDCWAVGSSVSASGHGKTFAEHYNGRLWTAVSTPNAPTWPDSGLTAVACTTKEECWASGEGANYGSTPSTGALLMLHYDGTAWHRALATAPQEGPYDGTAYLNCPSAAQCVLLTIYPTSGGGDAEAGEIYNGARWSALAVPPGVLVQGASCPSVDNCYIIGGPNFNVPNSPETLYHFGGVGWTQGPELITSLAGVSLDWTALACSQSRLCLALGGASTDPSAPLVVSRMSGSAWASPRTIDATGSLNDLVCSNNAECVAGGATPASPGSSDTTPIALRLAP
jgi:hypothetical protein